MDSYSFQEHPGQYAGKHPVAADTVVSSGGLVARDSSGNAVDADSTVTGFVLGRSDGGADNTGGAAGDKEVLVKRGIFALELDDTNPPTKAHIGKRVFATAPDTVAFTGTCSAGILLGFDTDGKALVDTTRAETGAVGGHDTDGATLTVLDSGAVISNLGASGAATWVLPKAVPGLEFRFAVKVAQQLRIDPNGTETIELPSTAAQQAAGKYIVADAIGEFIHLRCLVAGTWSVVASGGTWTAEV